jgi:hypothetical protein
MDQPSELRGRRALVVVNETVSGEQLSTSLHDHLGDQVTDVFVLAPALAGSALKHTMGDVDDAIEPARRRLESTIEELRKADLKVEGEVGDSDPIQAIGDEIIKFDPEQIIVVAHRDEEGAFAEKGLLEQAERDFDLPVLELVVDRSAEPTVLDVKSTKPVAGRKKGWRPSNNWPPLSRRDVGGILVAIVGTLVLGALAAKGVADSGGNGNDHEEGRLGAEAVVALLIALGMALVNLAHVVGLLLFQSVSYEGIFSRFLARVSLIGTPVALVIVAVLVLLI